MQRNTEHPDQFRLDDARRSTLDALPGSGYDDTVEAPSGCFVRRFTAGPISRREAMEGLDSFVAQRSRAREGAILLFYDTLDPIVPANRFLKQHCNQYRSLKTQHAYADDLAVWWSWLGGHGLPWDGVDLDDLDEYSAGLAGNVSPRTGRLPSASTVIRRVSTVELFYRWSFAHGLLGRDVLGENPDADEPGMPRSVNGDRARKRSGAVEKPKRNRKSERVRPLSQETLKSVLDHLGPNPFQPCRENGPSIRNRLVAEVAYATGMRVDEVCALTVPQLDALKREMKPETPTKLVPFTITVTKGGGKREVYLHYRLWKAIFAYVKGERALAMDKRLELDRQLPEPVEETTAVFVNGLSSNERDIGRKVRPETVSRAFTRAVVARGFTHPEPAFRMDDETGAPVLDSKGKPVEYIAQIPNHTFHDLRHTFAVRFYRHHVENGRSPPWKKLQAILGHTLLKTTTDVYLRFCDMDEAALSDRFCDYVPGHVDVEA